MNRSLLIFIATSMLLSVAKVGTAQNNDNKKFRFKKLSWDVKKESKKLEKEGYKAFVGQPPLNQQLDKSYRMQAEADDSGFPKWIVSSGSSVANTQAAGEMQSIELAKSRLVGLIETNFRAVIENTVANNQINAEEAVSVTKSIEVSANRVAKKLGMIVPVVKIYRRIDTNFEVQVNIAYNYDLARKAMLDEMKVEFEKESEDVRAKYEQFLNPDLQPDVIKNTNLDSE
jgi:hypothetical protein